MLETKGVASTNQLIAEAEVFPVQPTPAKPNTRGRLGSLYKQIKFWGQLGGLPRGAKVKDVKAILQVTPEVNMASYIKSVLPHDSGEDVFASSLSQVNALYAL